jgi:hypothetical protein
MSEVSSQLKNSDFHSVTSFAKAFHLSQTLGMIKHKSSGPRYDNIFSIISFGNPFIDNGSPAVMVDSEITSTLLPFDSIADVICT